MGGGGGGGEERASLGSRDKARIVPCAAMNSQDKNNVALCLQRDKAFLGHSQLLQRPHGGGAGGDEDPLHTLQYKDTRPNLFRSLCAICHQLLQGAGCEQGASTVHLPRAKIPGEHGTAPAINLYLPTNHPRQK